MYVHYWCLGYLAVALVVNLRFENQTVRIVASALAVTQIVLFVVCQVLGKRNIEKNELAKLSSYQSERYCDFCKTYKPPRVYHCSQCNLCRFRMDHHCNFVGVCIYSLNTKVYIYLLLVNELHSILNILYILSNVKLIFNKLSFLQTLGAIVFGLCCLWLSWDNLRLIKNQYLTISTNQTLVETLKHIKGRRQPFQRTFKELFGSSILSWINPVNSRFHSPLFEGTFKEEE